MNKAEKIWNEYGRLLLSVARGFFGDTPDAEDAAEDAVERILQNLDRFDEVPSPRARSLCAIITKNICLDILRRRKKLPEEPLDEEDSPPDAALSVPSAEQAWFSAKTVEAARRCIAELPDGYADILRLSVSMDMKPREIAKVLGISDGAARVRLFRAREALIKLMKEEGSL
ncbi:MAG: sigma-70 family RNA polymerase sigma factor [Clostridia bacterium]|nr:sigma-70 family RNA polymerase sigma factor [Clostridia bacterium]